MKKIIEICDACGKETTTAIFKIPLLCDGEYIKAGTVDLCELCAVRISSEYYKIAHEHDRTGLHIVMIEEEEHETNEKA